MERSLIAITSTALDDNTLPRLQTLLAYLLLQCQAPTARQQIAFQFWPDSIEKQAHTNLRKLLFQLRNALPDPDHFLLQDHLTVLWRPEAPHTADVVELRQLLAQSSQAFGLDKQMKHYTFIWLVGVLCTPSLIHALPICCNWHTSNCKRAAPRSMILRCSACSDPPPSMPKYKLRLGKGASRLYWVQMAKRCAALDAYAEAQNTHKSFAVAQLVIYKRSRSSSDSTSATLLMAAKNFALLPVLHTLRDRILSPGQGPFR